MLNEDDLPSSTAELRRRPSPSQGCLINRTAPHLLNLGLAQSRVDGLPLLYVHRDELKGDLFPEHNRACMKRKSGEVSLCSQPHHTFRTRSRIVPEHACLEQGHAPQKHQSEGAPIDACKHTHVGTYTSAHACSRTHTLPLLSREGSLLWKPKMHASKPREQQPRKQGGQTK